MKTFRCDFGNGVACEVSVPDAAPPKQTPTGHILAVQWEGKPTKAVLRPYIAWMNSVNALLAQEWGVKLMHVFLDTPSSGDMWSYEPGKPPKFIKRVSLKPPSKP